MGGELVEPPISHLKKYIAAKLAILLQKIACRNVKSVCGQWDICVCGEKKVILHKFSTM